MIFDNDREDVPDCIRRVQEAHRNRVRRTYRRNKVRQTKPDQFILRAADE